MKPTLIDELSQRIGSLLPEGVQGVRNDLEHNIHVLLQETLDKLNLVTREEFEIQSALLQRTREKVDRLEKQLDEFMQKN